MAQSARYHQCFYSHNPVFETMVSLSRSMASSLVALPRSCHDLGKDAMAMQDRAKANHDLCKDAMINHVLAKGSMVPNPFFGKSQCLKPWYPCKIHVPARRFRRYSRFAFRYYNVFLSRYSRSPCYSRLPHIHRQAS